MHWWIITFSFLAGFFLILGVLNLAWTIPERGRLRKIRQRLEFIADVNARERDPYLSILRDELLSDIPAFHKFLSRFIITTGLQKLINQADLKIRSGVVILISLVMAVGTGFVLSFFNISKVFALTVGLSIFVGMLPYLYILRVRRRRFNRFEEHFPEALELMGRALRAGHAFTTALEMVAMEMPYPISMEFEKVFVQQNFGLPLRNSLINLMDRVPLMDVRFFATAVLIQKETGGNLAEILDKLGHVIRERFKLRGHVKAVSAQGRLSGMFLCLLPIIVAVLMVLISPNYIGVLYKEQFGRYILATWMICQVVGFLAIRKIIRIKI
jgi:tight adherence protein B